MTQIFGHFINKPTTYHEYLALQFSSKATPTSQRWRNNGLSADFLANYFATFLPTTYKQTEFKGTISYIANELLENAMKFNQQTADLPISMQLYLHSDHLLLFVTNSISCEIITQFQSYIQELMSADPQELWFNKLAHEVNIGNNTSSGLGLLTMLLHYQAKLGWKFETLQNNPEVTAVTTLVQLTI